METSHSSISLNDGSLLVKLQKGENIRCLECKKGFYIPFNKKIGASTSYWFKCNNCGKPIYFEKNIVIE